MVGPFHVKESIFIHDSRAILKRTRRTQSTGRRILRDLDAAVTAVTKADIFLGGHIHPQMDKLFRIQPEQSIPRCGKCRNSPAYPEIGSFLL
jgi:hypothetical protein